MVEFDCTDCGRHIIAITEDKPPEGPFCATCLHLPGWFRDPVLRKMFDPDMPAPAEEKS